jgi:hypothetical protein
LVQEIEEMKLNFMYSLYALRKLRSIMMLLKPVWKSSIHQTLMSTWQHSRHVIPLKPPPFDGIFHGKHNTSEVCSKWF